MEGGTDVDVRPRTTMELQSLDSSLTFGLNFSRVTRIDGINVTNVLGFSAR